MKSTTNLATVNGEVQSHDTYKTISKNTVVTLQESAKSMQQKDVGLPSVDSIQYYPFDEKMDSGENARFTLVAPYINESVNEDTGEVTLNPAIIFIDKDGTFWKNMATMVVAHFARQKSGYQCQVTFKGYKKTSKGNKMQLFEFRPLIDKKQ